MSTTDLPAGAFVPVPGPIWLSGAVARDPQARALLLQWSLHPWITDLRFPLADRIEELGDPVLAGCVRQGYHCVALGTAWASRNRRARARGIRAWRCWLKATFGDFEANTLPCEVPADTPDDGPPF